jgi:hypothetical protein
MDEKPEALRLADVLWPWHEGRTNNLSLAAAELRRLHEANQEQLKTLRDCVLVMELGEQAAAELLRLQAVNEQLLTALQFAEFAMDNCPLVSQELNAAIKMARVAIAKATGGGQ